MEKWRCRGKSTVKQEIEAPYTLTSLSSVREKKRDKRWSLGGLLKRKSKSEPASDIIYKKTENLELLTDRHYVPPKQVPYRASVKIECHPKAILQMRESQRHTTDPTKIKNPQLITENAAEVRTSRRGRRLKARVQRERQNGTNSSSEDEKSASIGSLTCIEDTAIQNLANRRTRGARTERYMKRFRREDAIEAQNNVLEHPVPVFSALGPKKYPSDTLPSYLWSPNSDFRVSRSKRTPIYYQSYCSEQNIAALPHMRTELKANAHERPCQELTWPQARGSRIPPSTTNELLTWTRSPPEPPPRSSKPRVFSTSLRLSLHSDMENSASSRLNTNCHSLDRAARRKDYHRPKKDIGTSMSSLEHYRPQKTASPVNHVTLEDPIVPSLQPNRGLPAEGTAARTSIEIQERRRHSKNLEEALQELETIYNSLRLSDEDLLDRAEQRSMEEYRDKVATMSGSIKSSSDTSSSYETTGELGWRHANFDPSHDTRLKDDMAYRRMHPSDKQPSNDLNQPILTRISYLAASPTSIRDLEPTNHVSRKGTPDLTRDDVVFRSINHANNTLKVAEPQPPFGIPLGPVTAAAESDYLHVEASQCQSRSLYLPKTEPDVVSDDLAFRNLRKDASKNLAATNFLPKSGLTPELKKRRAVRSLSADLYGIINKNSQHSWYREYVKLNRPVRGSDDDREESSSAWFSNREYCDLDINGNRRKSEYKGRVQVCVPTEDQRIVEKKPIDLKTFIIDGNQPSVPSLETKEVKPFTENELSEYQQLCRDLESLIRKTSEKVQAKSEPESCRNSLAEFVEWEELLRKKSDSGSGGKSSLASTGNDGNSRNNEGNSESEMEHVSDSTREASADVPEASQNVGDGQMKGFEGREAGRGGAS